MVVSWNTPFNLLRVKTSLKLKNSLCRTRSIYVFHVDRTTHGDYFATQTYLIGVRYRDRACLLRGTN